MYNNEITQLRIPKSVAVGVLALLGAAFAVVHAIYRFTTVFQLAFGTLASLCAVRLYLHYTRVKNPRARAVAMSYVRNSLIGVVFWMLDYHYCQSIQKLPVNPQGHAWCVDLSRRGVQHCHGQWRSRAHVLCCDLQVAHLYRHFDVPRPCVHAVRTHGAAQTEG